MPPCCQSAWAVLQAMSEKKPRLASSDSGFPGEARQIPSLVVSWDSQQPAEAAGDTHGVCRGAAPLNCPLSLRGSFHGWALSSVRPYPHQSQSQDEAIFLQVRL